MVGLCTLLILGNILSMGVQLIIPHLDVQATDTDAIRLMLYVSALSQLLCFLLPSLIFVKLYQGSLKQSLNLDFKLSKWGLAGVAVTIFLLIMPANDWFGAWNEGWALGSWADGLRQLAQRVRQMSGNLLSLQSPFDIVLLLLIVALIPAICEELLFRGILQPMTQHMTHNAHAGIVLTALIFSVAHGDIFGLVPRFFLGLLLGYVYYYSGSMLVNVSAHFFNNAAIVVMYALYNKNILAMSPEEPMLFPWFTTFLCTIAAAVLFSLYFVQPRQKTNPRTEKQQKKRVC